MIVIIDNYDSFTYNLFQYFQQMTGDVRVYRNDQVTTSELFEIGATLLVLSPGPGHPGETGVSADVLREFSGKVPILGICLGHQLIVDFFGGSVIKGLQPMQGKVTRVTHDGQTIFENLPSSLQVTRYHSLVTPADQLPPSLEVSATSEDGVVMAVRHRHLPVEGIQFHPESIMTEYGYDMLYSAYQRAETFSKEGIG
ncbi:aminodeoxychorismate/anthranilate synthase component II [Halobacillus locisalis]|uniref:Aminodeoxychorismate/anthranilate synthase component II n=2 Tax=Halobacillus locisalis TaxID=220753 RepID=A0A838CT41_9BACI|nr:aminodeoxychorismate/anthranilate synthase component II [Halobacillus locisalis]MBA2175068.1 aminodeoxychorismate/anthranilate synthase component II [Halobacillus locisalis]